MGLTILLFFALMLTSGCSDAVPTPNSRDAPRLAYPLEFDERCADQARKRVVDMGFLDERGRPNASWDSNYNVTFARCFARVFRIEPGIMSTIVVDAHRGVQYANRTTYARTPDIDQCSVVLPTGEQRQCKSQSEFEQLLTVYMGDLALTPR